MLGLNETAALRRCTGLRGGRPTYAEPGERFACRSEPASRRSAGGDAAERSADLRVFAQGVDVLPGDRIELDGASYRVAEVRCLRGWRGTHHLELTARAAEKREAR